jgi:uncharacterized protein
MNEPDVLDKTAALSFGTSPIHGSGAFAKSDLDPGTRVIEYVGEKITKDEAFKQCELNNEYIFYLDEQFDLNGKVSWNPARLINHSCAPNCDAECIEGRIWLIANRPIRAGEEVTFNYNYDLEDYQSHPCRCGAPECVGYIVAEEYFELLRGRG